MIGRVIDEDTGKGVSDAFVYVKRIADEVRSLFPDGGGAGQCVGDKVVLTDEHGVFEVDKVDIVENQMYLNNRYVLFVYKRGYEYRRTININGKIYIDSQSEAFTGNEKNIVLKVTTHGSSSSCGRFCYLSGLDATLCSNYNDSMLSFIEQLFQEASEYGVQKEYWLRYMDMCQYRAHSMQMHGVDYTVLYKYGCEEHIKNSRVIRSWK
jgi:hypothetical protein